MAIENINEVVEYVTANKESDEVKAFISTLGGGEPQYTPEGVQTFLDTDEGRKLIQPMMDSFASKSINTWKANNLSNIIEEEMVKRQVVETPEQKAVRELREQMNQLKEQNTRERLRTVAMKELNDRKLPSAFLDYTIGESEEATRNRIHILEMEFKAGIEKAMETRLKGSAHTPKISGGESTPPITKKDIANMGYEELAKLQKENPVYFAELTGTN